MTTGVAIHDENETLIRARFTGKSTCTLYNPFSETKYVAASCLEHTSFREDVWVLIPAWQKRFLPIIYKASAFHLVLEVIVYAPLFGAVMLPAGGAIPLAILAALWILAFGFLELVAISTHHKIAQHAEREGCFIGVPFMYIHDQWINDFLEIDITNTHTMAAAGVDTERGTALLAIAQKRQMLKFKVMLYGTTWGSRYMGKRFWNCLTAFVRCACGLVSAFCSFLYGCGAGEGTHTLSYILFAVCCMAINWEILRVVFKYFFSR